ncbi:lanthionine synthetase C family protein [Streptacidiphilus albus]|uniref:lanthionine synthetase C family protein n=1 Tax=Streptacidiphilus albus TaxID=105425 RepID=UPI00054C5F55|nr:lanthionine synthetase C family protein [Streptacidiphilus albus]
MTPDQILTVADGLASPTAAHLPTGQPVWRQSLAHGVPGIALLHTELAAAGIRPWNRVRNWLAYAVSAPLTSGTSSGLFYGAPAVAYALAGTAAVRPGAYRSALAALEPLIAADAQRRAAHANHRIDTGQPPVLAEFDTLRGLAGIGAYLLRRDPGGEPLRDVLGYFVRLCRPLTDSGQLLPGWWTQTGPSGRPDDEEFPGGHANLGVAHGIAGQLALAGLAATRGITVPGQVEAISALCEWLDSWRLDTHAGPRWPYMITRAELAERPAEVANSGATRRPSWCYGTAGLARAQQIAAVATGDTGRRRQAEAALVSALADPGQRAATTDASLCHGHAGLARIAADAAADADPAQARQLRDLARELLGAADPEPGTGPGLLEGTAGTALAALASTDEPPPTGWDACLLIT